MHRNRDIGLISGFSCVSPAKPQARARGREPLPSLQRQLKQPLRWGMWLLHLARVPANPPGPLRTFACTAGVAAGSPRSHRPEPPSPFVSRSRPAPACLVGALVCLVGAQQARHVWWVPGMLGARRAYARLPFDSSDTGGAEAGRKFRGKAWPQAPQTSTPGPYMLCPGVARERGLGGGMRTQGVPVGCPSRGSGKKGAEKKASSSQQHLLLGQIPPFSDMIKFQNTPVWLRGWGPAWGR